MWWVLFYFVSNQQVKEDWRRNGIVKEGWRGIEKWSNNCSACTGPEFKPRTSPSENKDGSRKAALTTVFDDPGSGGTRL